MHGTITTDCCLKSGLMHETFTTECCQRNVLMHGTITADCCLKSGLMHETFCCQRSVPMDVVTYYEKALSDIGFKPELGKSNSESTARVSGVRESGEKLSITSMRGGSKAKEGESQTAIIATKPL